ncbi:MAG: NifX-associated nitrogen fixation protein [Pseudanabaena sp. Salubria-1]|jgi:probable nitrogen fixation protein|nr:NifX-associated nitrogen fixation protein [Pseudanabaena sp. Salubria-1]
MTATVTLTSTPATTTPENGAEVIKQSPFLQALVQQIRVNDGYGTYRNWADELLLKPFILTKQQKRKISVDGEVDPITKSRVFAFYRAIALRIEQQSGLLCQVVVDLSHEGFGWALIFSGRLLVTTRTLRDAQRFGFDSLEKLGEEGEKLAQKGVEYAINFPEVAKA